MPAHLPPPTSRSRRLGVLALALVAGVLAFAMVNRPGANERDAPVDTDQETTAPTVLGSVVETSTTLPSADPAIPATFAPSTTPAVAPPPPTSRPPATTTTTSPPATLVPPVSITSPPRTIPPTTSTSEPASG